MKVSMILLLTFLSQITFAYQLYCRCDCNQNSINTPIEKCGLCTREFCLKQDEKLCVIKDDKGDKRKSNNKDENNEKENIIISCFQVESFKDSIIIYSFIFTILGLLIYAGYKTYIH